jgi:Ca2+-binding EF-hand superfamily protein
LFSSQVYVDRAFDKMDRDGNGFIDIDELVNLLPSVLATGQQVSAEERMAAVRKGGGEDCGAANGVCLWAF